MPLACKPQLVTLIFKTFFYRYLNIITMINIAKIGCFFLTVSFFPSQICFFHSVSFFLFLSFCLPIGITRVSNSYIPPISMRGKHLTIFFLGGPPYTYCHTPPFDVLCVFLNQRTIMLVESSCNNQLLLLQIE